VIKQALSELIVEHGVVVELVLQYKFAKQFMVPQIQILELMIAPVLFAHFLIVGVAEHGMAALVLQY